MGKHRAIETPEMMWELFEAYCEEVRSNPLIKVEYVGKDGERVETPLPRPLTIEGFKNYLWEHAGDAQRYFNNRDGAFGDYAPIIQRAREVIRQQQIEGGMVGMYNANLTARLNGLTEKTENKHEVQGPVKITMNLNK